MTRVDLVDMIRREVHALAFDTLRNKSQEEKRTAQKPKAISEDELEYALFHGGNKPEDKSSSRPLSIRENYDSGIPQIQSSEIIEFENSFEQMLKDIEGASVVFDSQSNGYSLKMWIGSEGIEAGSSGVINMGKNGSIKWSYSLKNGLNVSSENVNIDKGNRYVFEKLFNNYNSWQKDWREKLTISPGQNAPSEGGLDSAETNPPVESGETDPVP